MSADTTKDYKNIHHRFIVSFLFKVLQSTHHEEFFNEYFRV